MRNRTDLTLRSGLAVSCLLLISEAARGQPVPLGPSFEVHPSTPIHENYQDVARSSTGEFVVVWETTFEATPESGILARRFEGTGEPLGAAFVVQGLPQTHSSAFAAVAAGADGGFLVAWQAFPTSAGSDSWARAYDPEGAPLGPPFVVHPPVPGFQAEPDVAADADGTFVVVWSYWTTEGEAYGARGRRFDSAGSALGPPFQVVEPARGGTAVAIARESPGRFVVAYHGPADADGRSGLYARAFSADGDLEAEFVVDDSPSYWGPGPPSISANRRGETVVAWTDEQFHSSSPRASWFDRSGVLVTELDFPPSSYDPTADFAPDGTMVLTWRELGDFRRGRLYSPNGVPIGSDFDVSDERWGIGDMSVAFDAQANPVFVGLAYDTSTSTEVHARLFSSGSLFLDGFESGDASRWSASVP